MKIFEIVRLGLFCLITIFLIYVSRKSFRSSSVHGFYRFFVFELTLALVILNLPYWFAEPLSLNQLVSWPLLLISIVLVVLSFYFLSKLGRSEKRDGYTANYEFENTVNLVKEGIYKYIRHPMYGSILFLSLGAFFKHVSYITAALTTLTLLFLVLTARTEEKENIKFFGDQYKEYMKNSKMFIPFLF